jgi:hypothetical protein
LGFSCHDLFKNKQSVHSTTGDENFSTKKTHKNRDNICITRATTQLKPCKASNLQLPRKRQIICFE